MTPKPLPDIGQRVFRETIQGATGLSWDAVWRIEQFHGWWYAYGADVPRRASDLGQNGHTLIVIPNVLVAREYAVGMRGKENRCARCEPDGTDPVPSPRRRARVEAPPGGRFIQLED